MTRPFPGLAGAVAVLGVALFCQWGASEVLARLWAGHRDPVLLSGLANLLALGTVTAVAFAVSGAPPRLWRPLRPGFWAGVVLSAAGGTVVLGELANLTAWLVPMPINLVRVFNSLTAGNPAVALFTLALVAPATEEVLFRGLLLRSFAARYGLVPGLVLSSALFALFHLNVWQALPAFAAGLFLGWLAWRTRSLMASLAAHALFNALPVVLAAAGVVITGYNSAVVPGQASFQPLPWLICGALALGVGLLLTKRWAPLSGPSDSATVAP